MGEYWTNKDSYRDVILNKLFATEEGLEKFKELGLDLQLKIIDYYEDEFKSIKLREACLDTGLTKLSENPENLDRKALLAKKIELVTTLLNEPNSERDQRLEKIFLETGFDLEDAKQYKPLFLTESYQNMRLERTATHGAGALFNVFLNDKSNLSETRQAITWLLKKQDELPPSILKEFDKFNLKPDQLRELFAGIKPLRQAVTQEIFASPKGFFNNKPEFDNLLQDLFGDSLKEETVNNPQTINRNKLKKLVWHALTKVFELDDKVKKLNIINRLLEQFLETPNMEVEDLVQVLLSSYGVVGVKLAQILSSQKEIQEALPLLYDKLANLKDSNEPISLSELKQAIETNPNLKNKNVEVIKLLGSASIKCVYLIKVDGKEMVLKVRRRTADKALANEIVDFNYLVKELAPIFNELFNIANIPQYGDRIFADIEEEVRLKTEIENERKMLRTVAGYNKLNKTNQKNHFKENKNSEKKQAKVIFTVPLPNSSLSNDIVMCESISGGKSFKAIKEERDSLKKELESINNPDPEKIQELSRLNQEIDFLETEISKFFIYSLDKFIHADLHDGNVFINKTKDGDYQIGIIDIGLAQEVDLDENGSWLSQKCKNLLTDPDFWKAVKSITKEDIKFMVDLANKSNLKLDQLLSANALDAFRLLDLQRLWLIGNLEVTQAWNIFSKFGLLKKALKKNGLDIDLSQIITKISNQATLNILEKSANTGSIKELPLILLSELDKLDGFTVQQGLWRVLLATSKTSYVIERIMENPEILNTVFLN